MKKIIIIFIVTIVSSILMSCIDLHNDKIKITIGMWPDSSNSSDVSMYNVWKERFEADNPSYIIEGEPFTYTVEGFQARANSKNLPTVFQTWFTEPQSIVAGNHAKDITSFVKKLGWFDKLDPELRKYLTFNDKLYGIPRDGYGLGLIINLDVFEEAGLATDLDGDSIVDIVDPNDNSIKYYPQTFDELLEYSRIIKDTTSKDGFIILNTDKNGGWQFSNIAWNFGAKLQILGADNKYHANLNSSEALNAMEYIRNLYVEGVVPIGNLNYSEWATRLGSGMVAMAICGNDVISNAITQGGLKSDKIAFVPIPKGPNGDQHTLFGGTPYMFSAYASDEQVEGAIKFLEYIGRSPELSVVSTKAMSEGMLTASEKNMLILPEIKPWINTDYLNYVNNLNTQYVNVKSLANFNEFYNILNSTRHPEEPLLTQKMYEILDRIIVKLNTGIDIQSQLNQINNELENLLKEYQN